MGWSRTERIIGGILALVGGFFFITCSGQVWLFQVPYLLLTGWFGFLQRVLPEVTFNGSAMAETAGVGALLGVGTHLFLRRMWHSLYPHDVWPVRWSASVVALLMLLFCATMATVGMGHHLGWLHSARTPMVESSWRFAALARRLDEAALCQEALKWLKSGGTDDELVRALMRKPDMREALERLHLVRLHGPGEEPSFLVFPRDPLLRQDGGGERCGAEPGQRPPDGDTRSNSTP